jgi:hypothetical protein
MATAVYHGPFSVYLERSFAQVHAPAHVHSRRVFSLHMPQATCARPLLCARALADSPALVRACTRRQEDEAARVDVHVRLAGGDQCSHAPT